MGDSSSRQKPATPSKSRQREYQLRHKAMGLCLYCPDLAIRGALCQRHYERHAIAQRNRYRKRHGLPVDMSPVRPQRGGAC